MAEGRSFHPKAGLPFWRLFCSLPLSCAASFPRQPEGLPYPPTTIENKDRAKGAGGHRGTGP